MKKEVFETGAITEPKVVRSESNAETVFMAGAVRAAQNSPPEIRNRILSDIQTYTDTPASQLDFMFGSDNDNNDHAVFDMPDSERRRKIIKENFLDAAE